MGDYMIKKSTAARGTQRPEEAVRESAEGWAGAGGAPDIHFASHSWLSCLSAV